MKVEINFRYLIFLVTTAALGGPAFWLRYCHHHRRRAILKEQFGWAFSSLLFGCVLGSLIAGRLADRYGRRKMLVWVAALFGLTSIATAAAPTFHSFIVARFVGGLAVGAASLLSPMYVAEVSPPSVRGRMGTFYQLSIVVGIVISLLHQLPSAEYWTR